MPEVKVYTVEQLMEIAATGACANPAAEDKKGACASPTKAALVDSNSFKQPGTKRIRFTVRNNGVDPLFFGLGESMENPGLSPLYPGSVFSRQEGINSAEFFVGDSLIPTASGPNALALQSLNHRVIQGVVSAVTIVRVYEADPILANNMQIENIAPSNGKCNTEQVSPECNSCTGTTNSNLISARFDLGLAPYDSRHAFGLLIPGTEEGPGTLYTIDVDLAFAVGAYGYVEASGKACN